MRADLLAGDLVVDDHDDGLKRVTSWQITTTTMGKDAKRTCGNGLRFRLLWPLPHGA